MVFHFKFLLLLNFFKGWLKSPYLKPENVPSSRVIAPSSAQNNREGIRKSKQMANEPEEGSQLRGRGRGSGGKGARGRKLVGGGSGGEDSPRGRQVKNSKQDVNLGGLAKSSSASGSGGNEGVCMHCKNRTGPAGGKALKLYRCQCGNEFHHLCAGQNGNEDMSRCLDCAS